MVIAITLMTLLLIALGGALGAVARYLLSSFVLRASGLLFPAGTFAVNLVGCLAFGFIIGAAQHRFVLTPEKNAFLLVGVLGGFTTFSSFAYESFALLNAGQFFAAGLNIVGQVVCGLIGLWAGYVIGH